MSGQERQPGQPGVMDNLVANPAFNLGMGILGSNTGHYGAFAPAMGRGAMMGMESLRQAQEAQAMGDYRQAQLEAAKRKAEQDAMMREAWSQMAGVPGQPSGEAGGIAGGPPGGGFSPVSQAGQIRNMALRAGMMGNDTLAGNLMKLSYDIDPSVQSGIAMAKAGAEYAFAGPKAQAETAAKAAGDFVQVGSQYMSKAEMMRLEQGRKLAGGDAMYSGMLAIEAPPNFDPTGRGPVTRSGAQAVGIPQMMPGTLTEYGHTPESFAALSPQAQATIGQDYYSKQLQKYGDPLIAAAAYNWGPGNVDQALKDVPPNVSPVIKSSIVYSAAPQETREYMQRASAYSLANQAMSQQAQNPLAVPSQAQLAEREAFAKAGAEDYTKARQTIEQSVTKIGTLDLMDQLLDQIKTGAFQPTINDIKAYADALGFNVPGIERLAPVQAFDALAKQMTLKARTTADGGGMPGAMSDADREFLRKMVPGLEKTKGANRLLIDISRKLAQREAQIARLKVNYKNKYGTMMETTDPQTGQKVSIDDAIKYFVDNPANALFSQDYIDRMMNSMGPSSGGF